MPGEIVTTYFEKLLELQNNAYAPYSKFRVASILVTEDGQEFSGVNVENASFGGTICAERSSIVSAISNLGSDTKFRTMHLVAGDSDKFAMPCGFCRQVINEFVEDDFVIVVYNNKGEKQECTIRSLLPNSFSKEDLV
ncbi:MAG: cytidine deaminase [Candidatus Azotimanducaceae bacterium]|jgi:cytidine deaminase